MYRGRILSYSRGVPFVIVLVAGIVLFVRRIRRETGPLRAATCWSVIGGGIALTAVGLLHSLYFEPTAAALKTARRGHVELAFGLAVAACGGGAEYVRRRNGRR
jgi:hypothetical protein